MKIAERMLAAVGAARELGRGREVVCVSHQLPIWTMRNKIEGRPFAHDPRSAAVRAGEPDVASGTRVA